MLVVLVVEMVRMVMARRMLVIARRMIVMARTIMSMTRTIMARTMTIVSRVFKSGRVPYSEAERREIVQEVARLQGFACTKVPQET